MHKSDVPPAGGGVRTDRRAPSPCTYYAYLAFSLASGMTIVCAHVPVNMPQQPPSSPRILPCIRDDHGLCTRARPHAPTAEAPPPGDVARRGAHTGQLTGSRPDVHLYLQGGGAITQPLERQCEPPRSLCRRPNRPDHCAEGLRQPGYIYQYGVLLSGAHRVSLEEDDAGVRHVQDSVDGG